MRLFILFTLVLLGSSKSFALEAAGRPGDPTVDATLVLSDWVKAADDVADTMNPYTQEEARRALERFKLSLDSNRDNSMDPAELHAALRELEHSFPYLEGQVIRRVRQNNPITPR